LECPPEDCPAQVADDQNVGESESQTHARKEMLDFANWER